MSGLAAKVSASLSASSDWASGSYGRGISSSRLKSSHSRAKNLVSSAPTVRCRPSAVGYTR
jgi:hypothetical protein